MDTNWPSAWRARLCQACAFDRCRFGRLFINSPARCAAAFSFTWSIGRPFSPTEPGWPCCAFCVRCLETRFAGVPRGTSSSPTDPPSTCSPAAQRFVWASMRALASPICVPRGRPPKPRLPSGAAPACSIRLDPLPTRDWVRALPKILLYRPAMRVAFFGGSFNPPHVAHQLVALYVLETEPLDELWFVPCWKHPFDKALAPYAERLQMCRLAAVGLGARVKVSDV